MKRRLLSILMVFIMIVTLIPLNQVFAAFGETGDPIVEGSAAIDILINAGTNSEVLAGDLQDKLYEKLKELLWQEGIDVNVRINTPSVELDTNDLSDWYVYDHYDPYHQGDTGTVAPTAAVSQINSSTDYSPTNIWKETFNSNGKVSDLRPYFTNKATNNFVSYTLAKWVDLVNIVTKPIAGQTGDFPYNYGEVGSNSQRGPRVTMLGAFDQHIYSRNGIIDFVGYYTYNYNDFLFFPCASKEEKQVTFDIDSSGVNVHSLSSAGFLINTGIYYKESDVNKTTPYISGYVLCYEYDGGSSSNYVEDPVPDRISLYQIKEDTKAVDFHNNITGSAKSDTLVGKFCGAAIATTQLKDPLGIGTPAGTGSSKNASGSYVNQSLVKTARLCGDIEWDSKMNIRLTITPEILLVEQKPQSSDNWITVIDVDGGVPVGTSTTSAANPIYYSGAKLNSPYNGFGPIVGYTAVGHTCQRASQFTYSNIRMAYINQTDKIFQLLSGANYIQNADLYFIDLTDDGANRRLVEDGNNAAAYMQAKKIRYITNNPNDELLDNDGKGTTTGPLGENGLWMDSDDYRENNMSPIDIDALAEAIAKYILAQYGGAEPDYGDDLLPLSDPVALLSLVRDVNNVTTSFVDIVKRDLVGENGLKIFGYDIESKPSDGADIIQYDYEIIFPGGKTIIVSRTDPNEPLLIITNDKDEWPKGEYTVILKVTDEKKIGSVEIPDIVNKESQPVIVKFHIVEDIIPPLVETVTITDGKITFTASDIGGYGVVGYELVCTPIGDGFSYGGVSYATNDGIQTFQIAVPGITAGSQTDLQTVEDVILPAGEYEIKLVVYDMAGNKTDVALPCIDYIGEKLIGLNPGTSGSGWTAADGTVNIADGWMGQNVVYTTTNSISDKDDKAIPGINTTVISIAVPERPAPPSTIRGTVIYPDKGKIKGVNNTMEYKASGDAEYTTITGNEVIDLNRTTTYYVRYKAVQGIQFSGTPASPSFNTYTVSGSAITVTGDPLEGMEAEIWLGKNKIAGSEISNEYGWFSFDNIPDGIYNLVVKNPNTGEVVTTIVKVDGDDVNVIVILEGLKNTIVKIEEIDSIAVPDIVIEGLPELINILPGEGEDGVTQEDLDKVDGGGKLEIVLYANAFEEDTIGYEVPVSKLIESASTDERVIGLYLDLTVTKYLWETLVNANDYNLADETTPLNQLPELIKVYIPLDGVAHLDGESDLRIYRYHNGVSDEIPEDVPNIYREYFELSGNTVILYVRRFSEYAITYSDPSLGGVTLTVNKDGVQWSGADIYIKLKGSSDPNDQHIITNAVMLQNIKPGIYEIIVNSKNTGKTITVRPGRDDAAVVINYYTLTLTAGTGIGSVTGGGVYCEGEVVTITASAAYNYIFNGWTADPSGIYGDLSKQNTVITMPGYALELTASAKFFTGGGNSGNGSSNIIIIPEHGGKVTATPSYPGIGDKVAVTVKPDAGYELDRLIITDEYGKALDFIDNGDSTYSYRQPVGVVTIDATFKKDLIYDTGSGDSDNKGDPGDEPSEIKLPDDTEQSTDIPNDTEQSTNIPDETEQGLNAQKENGAENNLVSDGSSNIVKDNEPKTGENSFPLNIVIMLSSIAFIIRILMDKKSINRSIKRRILGFKPNE